MTRADAVLTAANDIVTVAVARHRAELVQALEKDGVLAAIDSLVAAADAPGVRASRQVIVGWLSRHLSAEPIYEPGRTLELPASELRTLSVVGEYPSAEIVRVSVLESGWKSHGRTVAEPVVRVAPLNGMGPGT
jgi:hypothetical protein